MNRTWIKSFREKHSARQPISLTECFRRQIRDNVRADVDGTKAQPKENKNFWRNCVCNDLRISKKKSEDRRKRYKMIRYVTNGY